MILRAFYFNNKKLTNNLVDPADILGWFMRTTFNFHYRLIVKHLCYKQSAILKLRVKVINKGEKKNS